MESPDVKKMRKAKERIQTEKKAEERQQTLKRIRMGVRPVDDDLDDSDKELYRDDSHGKENSVLKPYLRKYMNVNDKIVTVRQKRQEPY